MVPKDIWEAMLNLRSDQHSLYGSELEIISTATKLYTPKALSIRPFSVADARLTLAEDIYDGRLSIEKLDSENYALSVNDNTRIIIEPDPHHMKIAYHRYFQDELLEVPLHVRPDTKLLLEAKYSVLRHIFDKYLVEIGFSEHIRIGNPVIEDDVHFYKILPPRNKY